MVVCGGEICCDVSNMAMILGGGCVSLFLCDRWKKDGDWVVRIYTDTVCKW